MDKIHARIQESVYTKAEWEAANPVLLKGEKGFVSDDPNLFKIGDGVTAWNSLPWRGYTGTIAQVTGDNENAVMSQKATVAAIKEGDDEIKNNLANLCDTLSWDDAVENIPLGSLGMQLVSEQEYPDY